MSRTAGNRSADVVRRAWVAESSRGKWMRSRACGHDRPTKEGCNADGVESSGDNEGDGGRLPRPPKMKELGWESRTKGAWLSETVSAS